MANYYEIQKTLQTGWLFHLEVSWVGEPPQEILVQYGKGNQVHILSDGNNLHSYAELDFEKLMCQTQVKIVSIS